MSDDLGGVFWSVNPISLNQIPIKSYDQFIRGMLIIQDYWQNGWGGN
jgi:hypothetical protein